MKYWDVAEGHLTHGGFSLSLWEMETFLRQAQDKKGFLYVWNDLAGQEQGALLLLFVYVSP
jgi:hypothetical protein